MKKSIVQPGRLAGLALTAVLTLGASGAAQADQDDIFWSIAMSSPGVRVGISNAQVLGLPPVHVHPYPVHVPPPRVVYTPVYRVHPGYYGYGHGHGYSHGHGHSRHYGHDRHERRDHHARNDGYRGHGGDGRGHRSGGEPMHMGRR